jgi:hypothetical protein
MEPHDFGAFIGRNPGDERIYVATGDSGEGLTHGVVAGMLISDLIRGRGNPWAEIYDPRRVTMASAGEYLRENASMVSSFAEYVTGGEIVSVNELAPGQGAVIRQGLMKIAAFRDEEGKLHVRSASCTHMGCVVHFNPFERCWDCPCHGSQYAIDGTALNGPAVSPLSEVDVDEIEEAAQRRVG